MIRTNSLLRTEAGQRRFGSPRAHLAKPKRARNFKDLKGLKRLRTFRIRAESVRKVRWRACRHHAEARPTYPHSADPSAGTRAGGGRSGAAGVALGRHGSPALAGEHVARKPHYLRLPTVTRICERNGRGRHRPKSHPGQRLLPLRRRLAGSCASSRSPYRSRALGNLGASRTASSSRGVSSAVVEGQLIAGGARAAWFSDKWVPNS